MQSKEACTARCCVVKRGGGHNSLQHPELQYHPVPNPPVWLHAQTPPPGSTHHSQHTLARVSQPLCLAGCGPCSVTVRIPAPSPSPHLLGCSLWSPLT